MGLDHGLRRKHYVKNWDHDKPEERWQITVTRGGKPVPEIKAENLSYLTEDVIRWRKSNNIHAWFVKNVQDGVDDCREAYVYENKLKEFYTAVCDVLKDHSKAAELLPNQGGFFFGSTEYDQDYFDDLEETKRILAPVVVLPMLDDTSIGEYEYWSSW